MATRRRRKPPLQDAIEYAARGVDKMAELEVEYINSFKGRGVFAKAHFSKGDFVVEYRGQLINHEESVRRRKTYHRACTVFMFDFQWKEKTWCIDATQEDGSFGRLVNDDHKRPNCKMKRIITEAKPHLCLFALRDIQTGEEITYNYGGNDWPWRKQAEEQSCAADPCDTEDPRTAEKMAESPSSSVMQAEEQSCAADPCDTEDPRTAEKMAESPSSCHAVQ
ncbi:N-lysine methyltransferase KMT5A [Larimichthys crocea]|uniref:N-lysine methyltransferase KMT5A n=1 Tax=Larimichthys crocea TaxID=215358 RepID=A0A6G0IVM2_LARCR|nr:N-lysine methyltransferase KMT5A [Larimichthys crocea]